MDALALLQDQLNGHIRGGQVFRVLEDFLANDDE